MIITIEKLVHGGAGMGVADGKKFFVPFSAPGDVLDVEIAADHGKWSEGGIVRLIKPSPFRISPPCPVFGACGGCQWQYIGYDEQLKWKRAILAESIERIGKVKSPEVLPALASPKKWHYRNRIQLHVDSKGRVGFYKQKSKEVVEFAECAIADERLNVELNLNRAEIAKRDRGIALRLEGGDDTGSFAQINTEQNEQLKKVVVEWLLEIPHKTILELYAGGGNFTFAIAAIAERVVASDVDKRAIEYARRAQEKAGIRNIEFVCLPAKVSVAGAPAARAARRLSEGCDAVLLDPPRKGCAEAIEAIAALAPKSILYISCDPATLARDVASFAEKGFRFVRSLPVDMFPQTFHVESLSLFTRTGQFTSGNIL